MVRKATYLFMSLVFSFMLFGMSLFAVKSPFCVRLSRMSEKSLVMNRKSQEAKMRYFDESVGCCERRRGRVCERRHDDGCRMMRGLRDGRGCARRREVCSLREGQARGLSGYGQACGPRDRRGCGPRDGRGRPDANGAYTCPHAER